MPVTISAPFCLSAEKKICIDKHMFHWFNALPPPLDVFEAGKCLKQFVQAVSNSLIVLNDQYEIAHTDVRLENICFQCYSTGSSAVAIFIDLDRMGQASATVNKQ